MTTALRVRTGWRTRSSRRSATSDASGWRDCQHVALFADRRHLDARRIAGWTFACCVEVALECRSVGDAAGFRKCLDRMEQLSAQRLV